MKVQFSIEIARPPAEVFAYLADPRNAPDWQTATSEVRLEDAQVDVGCRYRQSLNLPGRRIESTVEVTAYEPPSRFAIHSTGGPIEFRVDHRLEPGGDGTMVRVEADGRARGVLRFAAPMLEKTVELGMRNDFERLKRRLESS